MFQFYFSFVFVVIWVLFFSIVTLFAYFCLLNTVKLFGTEKELRDIRGFEISKLMKDRKNNSTFQFIFLDFWYSLDFCSNGLILTLRKALLPHNQTTLSPSDWNRVLRKIVYQISSALKIDSLVQIKMLKELFN